MEVSGFGLSLHGSCLKPAGFLIAYAVSRNGLRTFDLQELRSGFSLKNVGRDIFFTHKVAELQENLHDQIFWLGEMSLFHKCRHVVYSWYPL